MFLWYDDIAFAANIGDLNRGYNRHALADSSYISTPPMVLLQHEMNSWLELGN